MGGCTYMKRRRLATLMAIDPHCWYCGIAVTLGEESRNPANQAVIEAARSRLQCNGSQPRGLRNYLSCKECAVDRSRFEFLLAKDERDEYWRRWRIANGKPQPQDGKQRA